MHLYVGQCQPQNATGRPVKCVKKRPRGHSTRFCVGAWPGQWASLLLFLFRHPKHCEQNRPIAIRPSVDPTKTLISKL